MNPVGGDWSELLIECMNPIVVVTRFVSSAAAAVITT